MLLHLLHQSLNLRDLGTVSGDGVRFRAGLFVGQCVEGCDGFITRAGFAAGDEDFGTACLQETGDVVSMVSLGWLMWECYPDAACSPRPREPPLTTATLPFKLKMLVKSCSWTSCSADAMVIVWYLDVDCYLDNEK
jgi:FAD/FMN-containing dehydrogenase